MPALYKYVGELPKDNERLKRGNETLRRRLKRMEDNNLALTRQNAALTTALEEAKEKFASLYYWSLTNQDFFANSSDINQCARTQVQKISKLLGEDDD